MEVTGGLPVITWLVLGLTFLAAISMHVPYLTQGTHRIHGQSSAKTSQEEKMGYNQDYDCCVTGTTSVDITLSIT